MAYKFCIPPKTLTIKSCILYPMSWPVRLLSIVQYYMLVGWFLVCVHGFFWNKAPMTLNNQLTTTLRWHPYLLTYNDVKSQHLPPFCHVLFTVKFSLPCCLERRIEVCISKNSYLCSLKNCTYQPSSENMVFLFIAKFLIKRLHEANLSTTFAFWKDASQEVYLIHLHNPIR